MSWIYSEYLIKNNEFVFYTFAISIFIMIVITFVLVKKELDKNNVNK